jgi:hypothetical protein
MRYQNSLKEESAEAKSKKRDEDLKKVDDALK